MPLNYSSLLITWLPPLTSLQNGIIRQYSIHFRHDTSGDLFIYNVSNATTLTINNLKPYSTYVISVAAFTVGLGPLTTPLNVQLPEAGMFNHIAENFVYCYFYAAPSGSPTNFMAQTVGNGTVLQLTWVQPQNDLLNGVLLGYKLNCSGENGHTISNDVTGTTAFLYGLQNNTHYTCQVCAYTSPGCGPIAVAHVSTYHNCKKN